MSGSRVPRDKVDRALPCPAHVLCNPGPVSYPLCASCVLILSLCFLSKMWVKKKKIPYAAPRKWQVQVPGRESASEPSVLVCGADSRCSEEGGLGPYS